MGDISTQTQEQTREPSGELTAADIRAMFRDMSREANRRMKEADQRLKETEQIVRETAAQIKETDRQMKETDRKIGKLGNRLGEVIEHLMSPKLKEKFRDRGYCFNHVSRDHEIGDQNGRPLTEIDVFLENAEYALAVEVKTHLKTEDVNDHVKRMGVLRGVADKHGDKRKYLGAVAGAIVHEDVLKYALDNGFFVIDPSGDTVTIEAPDGFVPRIW
jgi:hypothetical protein